MWGSTGQQSSKTQNRRYGIQNPPKDSQNQVKRLSFLATNVPGPGSYTPKNDLSAEGSYVLSNNVSAGKRMMLKSERDSFVD